MNAVADPAVESTQRVVDAVARVEDPEYPGLSIADLGMVESVRVADGRAEIDLVPTFSGCPALHMIRADVEAAVAALGSDLECEVTFLTSPPWSPDRITDAGRRHLADSLTVAVQITGRAPHCPRCGAATVEQSLFGPTRCRSVHRCPSCDEVVEVIR
jgi:ring-1,2-phenylacetyl-CoA epoxidase subunit PaaD